MRTLRSALPGGLRWRLTAWVAGVMLVSAAVIFLVIYTDTGGQLRAQIDRDIAGDTGQLAQALRPLRGAGPSRVASASQHYVRSQPYTATSTLLFVLVPESLPASNHPELFGTAAREDGETPAQQGRENSLGRKLLEPRLGYSTQLVPDVGRMRIHERSVSIGSFRVVAGAAEPLSVVERAQHGVARAFVLAGVIVLALALLASYLAGARVSGPLRRMAAVAARVDGGDLAPRMEVSPASGEEVRVLGEAFNHMLERLADAFRSQREFVADASHELLTPVTVIAGQLEVLAAQHSPSPSEVRRVAGRVQAEIGRMGRLVEDLLVLARAEQPEWLRLEQVDLPSFVTQMWEGLTPTAERRFELAPVAEGSLRADPDRLAQALRNLVRNAIDNTSPGSGLVRLEAVPVGSHRVRFAVVDDGPGIPPLERERVFERFHRTDRARSRAAGGSGLGLAIVRAIAQAHGGYARVVDPAEGPGARVEVVLPGFMPRAEDNTQREAGPQLAHRRSATPPDYPSSMDHERARQLLARERARIEQGLSALEREGPLEASDRREPGDQGSEDLYQDEFDQGRREDLQRDLAALERAEARLAAGTYGLSVESGTAIPDERLEALPTVERTAAEDQRYRRS